MEVIEKEYTLTIEVQSHWMPEKICDVMPNGFCNALFHYLTSKEGYFLYTYKGYEFEHAIKLAVISSEL